MNKLLVMLSVLLPCVSAHAYELNCPSVLEVQEKLLHTPTGWNVEYPPLPNKLSAVEFRQVGDSGDLKYDDEVKHSPATESYLWWFPDKKATYQAKCTYDRDGISLVKDLPKSIRSCYATYINGLFAKAVCSEREVMQGEL